MDNLRCWFEVPAITYFFNVFKKSFDLIDFEIEEFEDALLLDKAENVSSFIPDLVVRLLRGLYKTKDGLQVTLDNFNYYLKDLAGFHYTKSNVENPVAERDFQSLTTREKVVLLWDMCNWRLELEDVMDLTKNIDPSEMRIEPVGRDSEGYVYWYFLGTRLYRETVQTPTKKVKMGKRKPARTKSGREVRKRPKLDDTESENTCESETSDIETSKNLNGSCTSWSVKCSTVEHWQNFISGLKKNRKDKELYEGLVYMQPQIENLFKERELAQQRKLLMMAPRRCSDRISLKVRQRDEEDRLEAEERNLRNLQKQRELEEKQKLLEEQKAKERDRRYQEREKMLEERALRVKQREEQKLVGPNEEIKVSASKKRYTTESESDENDKLFAMDKVLNTMLDHHDSWPFEEPVKPEEAPQYYEFITNPMDFQTIGDKIKAKEYTCKSEFERDVLLVFDNCESYNGTFSPFTKMAMKVKRVFEKQMKKEFPPDVDEDDDDFFKLDDPPPKVKKVKANGEKVDTSRVKVEEDPASFLPARLGITQEALSKMGPAQLQLMMLKCNPKAAFSPSLLLQGQKNKAANNKSPMNIKEEPQSEKINPLHQLADTALKNTSMILSPNELLRRTAVPYSFSPRLNPRCNTGTPNVRGRPKKSLPTPVPPRRTVVVATPAFSHTGGLRMEIPTVKPTTTISWGELKKQLMTQMQSAGASIPADSPKWEQVKQQIISQMNGYGANVPKVVITTSTCSPPATVANITTTPTSKMFSFSEILKNKETTTTIAPSLLHIDHSVQPSISKVQNWLNSTREFIGKDEADHKPPEGVLYARPIAAKPVELQELQRAAKQAIAVNDITKLHSRLAKTSVMGAATLVKSALRPSTPALNILPVARPVLISNLPASQNIARLPVPSQNTVRLAVHSQNYARLAVPSQNAASLAVPSQSAARFSAPAQNASSLVVPSQTFTRLIVPSQNVAMPVTSQNAERLPGSSQNVASLVVLSQNPTRLAVTLQNSVRLPAPSQNPAITASSQTVSIAQNVARFTIPTQNVIRLPVPPQQLVRLAVPSKNAGKLHLFSQNVAGISVPSQNINVKPLSSDAQLFDTSQKAFSTTSTTSLSVVRPTSTMLTIPDSRTHILKLINPSSLTSQITTNQQLTADKRIPQLVVNQQTAVKADSRLQKLTTPLVLKPVGKPNLLNSGSAQLLTNQQNILLKPKQIVDPKQLNQSMLLSNNFLVVSSSQQQNLPIKQTSKPDSPLPLLQPIKASSKQQVLINNPQKLNPEQVLLMKQAPSSSKTVATNLSPQDVQKILQQHGIQVQQPAKLAPRNIILQNRPTVQRIPATTNVLHYVAPGNTQGGVIISGNQVLLPKRLIQQAQPNRPPASQDSNILFIKNNEMPVEQPKTNPVEHLQTLVMNTPSTVQQKQLLIDVNQLQKLKEEGRIAVTPTGQLVMLTPHQTPATTSLK